MKRSNFLAALALCAGGAATALADQTHTDAKVDPVPAQAPVAATLTAGRCDIAKIRESIEDHNNAMLLIPGLPDRRKDPNGIIFPPNENAMKTTHLCQRGALAVWKSVGHSGGAAAFNNAALVDQIKLLEAAVRDLSALDEKMEALRAKAKEIHERAQEYVGNADSGKDSLPVVRQKELLALLIKANGHKLLDSKAPYAAKTPVSAEGGSLLEGADGFYFQMKKLAEVPVVARAIKKDWMSFISGTARNDHDGQGFSREMMRVLWTHPQDDAFKVNAKFGALDAFDRATGQELRGLFYGVREDLNKVNQAVIRQYGPEPGAVARAGEKLDGRATREQLAELGRKEKLESIKNAVAQKTARELFDKGGKQNPSDFDVNALAQTVKQKMEANQGSKEITFTPTGADGKSLAGKTTPLPESLEVDPITNEQYKGIAEHLMQDKDIKAGLKALGVALIDPKGPEVPFETPAKTESGEAQTDGKETKAELPFDEKSPSDKINDMSPGCFGTKSGTFKDEEMKTLLDAQKDNIKARKGAQAALDQSSATAKLVLTRELANCEKGIYDPKLTKKQCVELAQRGYQAALKKAQRDALSDLTTKKVKGKKAEAAEIGDKEKEVQGKIENWARADIKKRGAEIGGLYKRGGSRFERELLGLKTGFIIQPSGQDYIDDKDIDAYFEKFWVDQDVEWKGKKGNNVAKCAVKLVKKDGTYPDMTGAMINSSCGVRDGDVVNPNMVEYFETLKKTGKGPEVKVEDVDEAKLNELLGK